MDKKEMTFVSMDLVNILSICVHMAKHQVGEISDEEFKKEIESIDSMLQHSRKRVAMRALGDLIDAMGENKEE